MVFHIGIENIPGDRSQAWVLGHPGCYAYGVDGEAALANAPQAIRDYSAWVEAHTGESWISNGEVTTRLEETWEGYTIDEEYELSREGYEVGAWFRHDWKPLAAQEISHGLMLLEWSRADLIGTVGDLSEDQLKKRYPGERWTIAGILKHVGGAEWWYLDRLGSAFPQQRVPEDSFKRLVMVRAHLMDILPDLVGSRQVLGIDGEFWSPRKLLRRAVWHERDHTDHIRKLMGG